MQAIDFSRSFVMWQIDTVKKPPLTVSHKPPYTKNTARVQLDCRCEITDKRDGQVYEFVLGASCKTERVGVERDIWTDPNSDFIPVQGAGKFLNIKTFDYAGKRVMLYPPSLGQQSERQVGDLAEAFDTSAVDIHWVAGRLLETPEAIIDAVLQNVPIVGRIELKNEAYRALIDFPIKTMNANDREIIYQTDTGPLLVPDLTRPADELIGGFELAFAAMNCPTWVEFLVRVPTPIGQGMSVYHYSQTVRWDSRNQIFALE